MSEKFICGPLGDLPDRKYAVVQFYSLFRNGGRVHGCGVATCAFDSGPVETVALTRDAGGLWRVAGYGRVPETSASWRSSLGKPCK